MKFTLISPPFADSTGTGGLASIVKLDEMQKSEGLPIAPPVLEYLAGLIEKAAPDVEIELIDANREDIDFERFESDIVGLTVLTPQAYWSYKTADFFRSRGIKVVLGGIHATALPDEAKLHADSVVIGEAEGVMGELIADAKGGRLKPFYKGEQLPLEGLPRPKRGLLKTKYPMGSFFTTRGCPFKCKFCSVYKFFGNNIRHRPIDEVVAQVIDSPYRMFWNVDDNIWGAGIDRSIKLYVELYRELSKSSKKKYWIGSGDLVSIQGKRGDEILRTAKDSGLTMAMVGWESENVDSLKEYNALLKQGKVRRDAIRKIKDHGIDIMLFIMVGGRKDTPDDYKRILDLCDDLEVMAHPMMVIPYPETELYEEYRPYLIPERGWDFYNGNWAVFHHGDPIMTPEFREKELIELRAKLFTLPRIAKRLWGLSLKGFPMTHFTSFIVQYPMGRAFKMEAKNRDRTALDMVNQKYAHLQKEVGS